MRMMRDQVDSQLSPLRPSHMLVGEINIAQGENKNLRYKMKRVIAEVPEAAIVSGPGTGRWSMYRAVKRRVARMSFP